MRRIYRSAAASFILLAIILAFDFVLAEKGISNFAVGSAGRCVADKGVWICQGFSAAPLLSGLLAAPMLVFFGAPYVLWIGILNPSAALVFLSTAPVSATIVGLSAIIWFILGMIGIVELAAAGVRTMVARLRYDRRTG